MRRVSTNGVEGLELIGGNAARAMEPELTCVAALVSPSTGIIDGHGYMLALAGRPRSAWRRDRLRDAGDTASSRLPRGFRVSFGGTEPGQFEVDAVVNCAGLSAQDVARAYRRLSVSAHSEAGAREGQLLRLCRPARLHAADLSDAGRWRAWACMSRSISPDACVSGPDVQWIETENYEVDAVARAKASMRASAPIGRDCRTARWCRIMPACGRSCQGPGEPAVDFLIEGPAQHGIAGLVNLFGIESPGLTSFAADRGRSGRSAVRKSVKRFSVRQRDNEKTYLAA